MSEGAETRIAFGNNESVLGSDWAASLVGPRSRCCTASVSLTRILFAIAWLNRVAIDHRMRIRAAHGLHTERQRGVG